MHDSRSVREWLRYLFPDELDALQELARSLPDSPVVVNIGAGGGTSGLAFMEARPDLILYTVDIRSEDSPLGGLYSERVAFESAGYSNELGVRWFQVHGDSKFVAVDWQYGLVDMVFVDGDHSFEGCSGDITAWMPLIKSGGIIAVHDYDKEYVYSDKTRDFSSVPHPRPWPGVDRAVSEHLINVADKIMLVDTLIAFRMHHK